MAINQCIEPAQDTIVLLANNLDSCRLSNVTLFNAAVSETTGVIGMSIPEWSDTGQRNFYQAHLTSPGDNELRILTVSLDAIQIATTIANQDGCRGGNIVAGPSNINRRGPSHRGWGLLKSLGYIGPTFPGSQNKR